jgi:hypothetical protein
MEILRTSKTHLINFSVITNSNYIPFQIKRIREEDLKNRGYGLRISAFNLQELSLEFCQDASSKTRLRPVAAC